MEDSNSPPPKRKRIELVDVGDSNDKNWRDLLCDVLEISKSAADKELLSAAIEFREGIGNPLSVKAEIPEVEPHYKNLYRIRCSKALNPEGTGDIYEDPPIIKSTDGEDFHLSANMLVVNIDRYIERNPGMSFAVIHEFVCCNKHCPNSIGLMNEWRESLLLTSENLYNALLNLASPPSFAVGKESQYWIFWAFHNLDTLRILPSLCDGIEGKHASVFSKYFCETKLLDFQSIRKLISDGHFTRQSLGYLFIPGDLVVIRSPIGDAYDICYEQTDWPDNSRFMIDSSMTKAFYRQDPNQPKELVAELKDDLGPLVMAQSEPPGDRFLLTAPTFIWGFNMWDKFWKKLAIHNVKDVDWDEKAFDNLVIDPDSKDVIQALVTNKIQNSMSTDLVRGKGNGLILLLHGPPGTGKTMTAESVAEHARKPLYRVTCGDIGTKPAAVEQYLKKVLTLGKSWDCVVLLDEAEVFLQERSLEDIERNALVSVFLRNLEYYDGILILTSNRVGTFDEGFRSRIQLAIHYTKLEQTERRKVWDNFVNRLSSDPIAAVDIDIRNLHSNLTELSKFELNGREIRNAINVARPLAKSEGRKVDFESLKKVIRVQQKFYGYMKEVNEGLDDEEVARDERKR
ncbi:hypothetical protein GQX73_g1630 [Xylaria multiplex]|uniref:AAA+ ATPase domain-containing protein n=1 Tax=Xylaria multiplex TaxID=323545 RepID=A0A7C8MWA9_9PEZI|nr:hypothetical protein GQX73_g1630 [Xylaria multiplex]